MKYHLQNYCLRNTRLCLPNITLLKKTKYDKIFTIYIFLYFKCIINLNDNCRIICRKMKMCLLNITSLHTFLYRITTRKTKSLFLHKNLTRKKIKISTSLEIEAKYRKIWLHWKKSTLTFNIRKIFFFFFEKCKFYKSKFAKTCVYHYKK